MGRFLRVVRIEPDVFICRVNSLTRSFDLQIQTRLTTNASHCLPYTPPAQMAQWVRFVVESILTLPTSFRCGPALVDLRRGGAPAPFPEAPVQTVRADFPHTAYRWSSHAACVPPDSSAIHVSGETSLRRIPRTCCRCLGLHLAAMYSLRWSSRTLSLGLLGLATMPSRLPPYTSTTKAGFLPSAGLLEPASTVL